VQLAICSFARVNPTGDRCCWLLLRTVFSHHLVMLSVPEVCVPAGRSVGDWEGRAVLVCGQVSRGVVIEGCRLVPLRSA